jgi:UDP-N-acetylglucosamine 2-epimerase (non-hydrolysing)
MKVMVVIGTRPEVIKVAPVIASMRAAGLKTVVCTTGQHREMLSQAMEVFSLQADVALDLMQPGQTLNGLASRLLAELDQVMVEERPDWVLVQGDTTTALCGGLAAFHRGVRVGHIEAGLRTGDLASPFPEEANRSLLARIATRHFAPTAAAKQALRGEGVSQGEIQITGNTVVDAIAMAQAILAKREQGEILASILAEASGRPLVLVTCHRRENFGGPLEAICQLIGRLCKRYSEYQWVFPVHLNPNVQEPVRRILGAVPNLSLLAPVDYLTSLALISRASLIVSDSGGIQEEAPSFGVPVVVMRNHTERREGIAAGFATLAGQDPAVIEVEVCAWLDDVDRRDALRQRANPYGDGLAAERIVRHILGMGCEEFNG